MYIRLNVIITHLKNSACESVLVIKMKMKRSEIWYISLTIINNGYSEGTSMVVCYEKAHGLTHLLKCIGA